MKWCFLLFFCLCSTGWSQTSDTSFLDGVAAYKTKDYKKAQELFAALAQENPNNPALLYNLGLAEYHLGRLGMALGLWRKARTLDHSRVPVEQAITFTEEQLFPDKNEKNFLVLIFDTLLNLPPWAWWILSLVSFTAAGWWTLEYGVKKRLTPNLWPTWLYFVYPVFLFATFFAALTYLQHRQVSATIVQSDIETRVGPSDTSPTLSLLKEGQLVSVEKSIGQWVQIRSQNGSPGWVPQQAIIIFKGR